MTKADAAKKAENALLTRAVKAAVKEALNEAAAESVKEVVAATRAEVMGELAATDKLVAAREAVKQYAKEATAKAYAAEEAVKKARAAAAGLPAATSKDEVDRAVDAADTAWKRAKALSEAVALLLRDAESQAKRVPGGDDEMEMDLTDLRNAETDAKQSAADAEKAAEIVKDISGSLEAY